MSWAPFSKKWETRNGLLLKQHNPNTAFTCLNTSLNSIRRKRFMHVPIKMGFKYEKVSFSDQSKRDPSCTTGWNISVQKPGFPSTSIQRSRGQKYELLPGAVGGAAVFLQARSTITMLWQTDVVTVAFSQSPRLFRPFCSWCWIVPDRVYSSTSSSLVSNAPRWNVIIWLGIIPKLKVSLHLRRN